MTLFILDTDSASLFLAGNKQLIHRVTQEVPNVVTTIVTGERAKAPPFKAGDVGGCGFSRLKTIAGL